MKELTVKERLPRDLLWMVSILSVWLAYGLVVDSGFGLGVDSHAYWAAWRGEMYDTPPATYDAFLYSPVFAQLIWPLAQLPWPVFGVVWGLATVVTLWWLVRVKPWYVAVPLFFVGTHEILTGNVNWLLALVVVFGIRHPGLWAFAFLTKVTPCLGPVWFLARGEWRKLSVSLGAILVISAVSWAVAPHLWLEWLAFLYDNLGAVDEQVGGKFLPPPLIRIPLVLALVVWGARSDRLWTLPVGMLLTSPVAGPGQFVLLLTLPRLAQQREHLRGGEGSAPSTRLQETDRV